MQTNTKEDGEIIAAFTDVARGLMPNVLGKPTLRFWDLDRINIFLKLWEIIIRYNKTLPPVVSKESLSARKLWYFRKFHKTLFNTKWNLGADTSAGIATYDEHKKNPVPPDAEHLLSSPEEYRYDFTQKIVDDHVHSEKKWTSKEQRENREAMYKEEYDSLIFLIKFVLRSNDEFANDYANFVAPDMWSKTPFGKTAWMRGFEIKHPQGDKRYPIVQFDILQKRYPKLFKETYPGSKRWLINLTLAVTIKQPEVPMVFDIAKVK